MQKNKVIKRCIAFVVVVAIILGGYTIYRKFSAEETAAPEKTLKSVVQQVYKSDIKETITASGTVYLADEHEIYAEGETNIIKNFDVEEGDTIEIGQLLVTYDVDDTKKEYEKKIEELELELENSKMSLQSIALPITESEKISLESSISQAEKNLYDAQVSLENYDTKISQQQTTISTAQRDVDNAKTDLEKAEKDAEDNKELLNVGAITQTEYDNSLDDVKKASDSYDDAVQAHSDAKQELEQINKDKLSAEYNVKNSQNSLKEAQNKLAIAMDVFSDEATVLKYKQQENQIKLSEVSLNDYKEKLSELVFSTTSPVNGIVTEICVDEGTYTEENTVMLKVADFNQLIVKASIAEYDAPNISIGQKVEMTSDGLEGKVYTGSVTKINPSASAESTTMGSETVVPVEISVDNPDGVLKPGYTLDLEIISVDRQDTLVLPVASVGTDHEKDEYYVYLIGDDNKITKQVVEVGVYGEVEAEILSGLEENQKVLSTVTENIKDGTSVEEVMQAIAAKQQTGNNDSEKSSSEEGLMPSLGLQGGDNQGQRNQGGMGGGMPPGGGGPR